VRDEREAQGPADDRGDRLDERDLLGIEAARGAGPVGVEETPATAAGGERRAQLGVRVHERPQLAPPGAALRAPAGGGVQVGDLPRAAGEVGELVEVGDLELVLPEGAADGVRHAVHDAGAERQQGVGVGRREDEGVHGHRGADLLGDGLHERLGRELLGGERVDPALRAREPQGRAR
jgi:hypothetical protein